MLALACAWAGWACLHVLCSSVQTIVPCEVVVTRPDGGLQLGMYAGRQRWGSTGLTDVHVCPRSPQSNDDEILAKQKEAEKVLAEARAAAQKEIQDAKSAAQDKQTKRLAEVKGVRGHVLRPLTPSSPAFGHGQHQLWRLGVAVPFCTPHLTMMHARDSKEAAGTLRVAMSSENRLPLAPLRPCLCSARAGACIRHPWQWCGLRDPLPTVLFGGGAENRQGAGVRSGGP